MHWKQVTRFGDLKMVMMMMMLKKMMKKKGVMDYDDNERVNFEWKKKKKKK